MVLTTTLGCFGAATTGQQDDQSAPPKPETASVSSAILASCTDDSVPGPAPIGECDGGCTTVRPSCATVTLDGKACPVQRGVGTGLDMGLDGNGWTLEATSDACGIILDVSGLDDQSYPQSSPTAVLGESRIMLFTGEAVDGGISGAYSSNAPSASVVVESGPVHGSSRAIKGHAHVVREDGKSHDVTYSLVF
jgi:hypothetical protein